METQTSALTLEEKFNKIKAQIEAIQDPVSPVIPVADYISEAENLSADAVIDKDQLTSRGINSILIDSMPLRIDAVRYVQGLWFNEQKAQRDAMKEWKVEGPISFELRDLLLDEFSFAFYDDPALMERVRKIREGGSASDMVQDLVNLNILGKNNIGKLKKTNFKLELLDQCIIRSDKMGHLLGLCNGEKDDYNASKILRDKAYTYLKESVDEIRRVGRFVFRNDAKKLARYQSQYKNIHR